MYKQIQSLLAQQGFAVASGVFEEEHICRIEQDLYQTGAFNYDDVKGNEESNLLVSCKRVLDLAAAVAKIFEGMSNRKMFPVKAFILDKTTTHNWEIPWHQDRKIAVEEKKETPGYTAWSVEAGIVHVQPPLAVMENLITARIHLDDCNNGNGAMRVIAGSHLMGLLSKEEITALVKSSGYEICNVKRGDLMLMKPLIVHDSPRSESDTSRRILQIEYGSELSNGLQWHNLPVSSTFKTFSI